MSLITNWKPGMILMKNSEVSTFTSAGGARFQYTLLKFGWPRRSAFSITPLSVATTWTYLCVFRVIGSGGGVTQNQPCK